MNEFSNNLYCYRIILNKLRKKQIELKRFFLLILFLFLLLSCNKNNNNIDKHKINEENRLIIAVRNKDISKIEQFLKEGDNVNCKDSKGNTILMIACNEENQKNVKIIEILLNYGADVNLKSKKKYSTFIEEYDAVTLLRDWENKKIQKKLLNKGYNNKEYLLQYAVESNNISEVINLIKNFNDLNSVNVKYRAYEPTTLLMFACYYGYFEIAKILIENGADVNSITDFSGFQGHSLYFAIQENHINIVKLLIKNGGQVNLMMKIRIHWTFRLW